MIMRKAVLRGGCTRGDRAPDSPPKGSADNPFQALVFDSWFDIYRGAVVLVRVMEGRITKHNERSGWCHQRSVRSPSNSGR